MAALAGDENFNRRGVELPEEGSSTVPARIGNVYARKRLRTGTEACPYGSFGFVRHSGESRNPFAGEGE